MSENILNISDAEWIVMRVVWSLGEATSSEIVTALDRDTKWKPRTIRTLIGRLTKKGALAYREQGREFIYRASVDEKHCKTTISRHFLDRIFGGHLAPFVANLVESGNYSETDIAELKRIVEQHTEPKGGTHEK
jgi:BlaI family transcriptional regulator, penicillinase repressor